MDAVARRARKDAGHNWYLLPRPVLGYADTWIDIVARTGIMQPVLAEALKEETRQRAAAGTYFEFTAAINVIARKTADPGASTSARPGWNDELEGSRATPAT